MSPGRVIVLPHRLDEKVEEPLADASPAVDFESERRWAG